MPRLDLQENSSLRDEVDKAQDLRADMEAQSEDLLKLKKASSWSWHECWSTESPMQEHEMLMGILNTLEEEKNELEANGKKLQAQLEVRSSDWQLHVLHSVLIWQLNRRRRKSEKSS